jgi:hypothetical protein
LVTIETGWAGFQGEQKMNPIASVIPADTENSSAPADGPASNLLSFASGVGVDDAFANLGVPYGETDTPAHAYTTFLSAVGVDDVFANASVAGANAGIGDPITTLGQTGDQVAAGTVPAGADNLGVLGDQGLDNITSTSGVVPAGALGIGGALGGDNGVLGLGPSIATSGDGSGPVSNLLSFASGVGVDDAFANLGVPYGQTDTPEHTYVTFLSATGVDDVFANAAGVGAVAGIGDPVPIVGNAGDDIAGGQFQFPALGGTGADSLVGEVGHLADLPAAGGAIDALPLAAGADAPDLAATAEPLVGDSAHIIPDTPLGGHLL